MCVVLLLTSRRIENGAQDSHLYTSPVFWLTCICLPVFCLLRDYAWKSCVSPMLSSELILRRRTDTRRSFTQSPIILCKKFKRRICPTIGHEWINSKGRLKRFERFSGYGGIEGLHSLRQRRDKSRSVCAVTWRDKGSKDGQIIRAYDTSIKKATGT